MSLFQTELYKLFRRKSVLLLCLAALLCNLIGVYVTARETGSMIPIKDYKHVMEVYREDPEKIDSTYHRIYEGMLRYAELYLEAQETGEVLDPFVNEYNYSSNYKNFSDFEVLRTFLERRDEAERYDETIRSHIAQAEANKKRFSIIGNQNAYSYRYQDAVIRCYADLLQNVDVTFDYVYGWDILFSYTGDILLVWIAVLLLAGVSVSEEQTTGMLSILTVTKKGRGKTAAAKIGAVLFWCSALAFLLRAETFLLIGVLRGYSAAEHPVQLLRDFVLCPFAWNCAELFLFSFLLLLLSVWFLASVVLAVSACTKSYLLSLAGGAVYYPNDISVYDTIDGRDFRKCNIYRLPVTAEAGDAPDCVLRDILYQGSPIVSMDQHRLLYAEPAVTQYGKAWKYDEKGNVKDYPIYAYNSGKLFAYDTETRTSSPVIDISGYDILSYYAFTEDYAIAAAAKLKEIDPSAPYQDEIDTLAYGFADGSVTVLD